MRYSAENIKNAFRTLSIPMEDTIELKFVKSKLSSLPLEKIQTHFFIHKKYPLYRIPFLPSHEYVVIDGKTFHPGSSNGPLLEEEPANDDVITLLEENCDECSRKKIKQLFQNDQNFNLFINNCQIILGNKVVTPLLWTGFFLLWIFCIKPLIIIFYMGLFSIIFALTYDKLNDVKNTIEYKTCPHVIRP